MLWSLIKILLFVAAIAGATFGAGCLMETGSDVLITVSGTEFVISPLMMVVLVLALICTDPGFQASPGVCNALVPRALAAEYKGRYKDGNGDPLRGDVLRCEYYNGDGFLLSNACVEVQYSGSDASTTLDVGGITTVIPASTVPHIDCDALARSAPVAPNCALYGNLFATSQGSRGRFDELNASLRHITALSGAAREYEVLDSVCSSDPCGFSPPDVGCGTLIQSDYTEPIFCSLVGTIQSVRDYLFYPSASGALGDAAAGLFCSDFLNLNSVYDPSHGKAYCVPSDYKADFEAFAEDEDATEFDTPIRDWHGNVVAE